MAKHKAKAEEEMAEKTKLVLKLKELEVPSGIKGPIWALYLIGF